MEDSPNPSYGRKAVSRRAAPINTSSFNENDKRNKYTVVGPPSSSLLHHKSKDKKREDYDVEARPLLHGSDHGTAASGGGTGTGGATTAATSPVQHAAKFADSWMGTMLKVQAKQAGRHVYNLRANMASKKGYHVQMPKRMLFYTGLIFLAIPLMLFFREEKHIHQNNGELNHHHHQHELHHQHDGTMTQQQKEQNEAWSSYHQKDRLRGHPTKKKTVTKESLQQLLGGVNNATSPSNSRKDHSNIAMKQQPDEKGTTASPGIVTASANGTGITDTLQQQEKQQQVDGDTTQNKQDDKQADQQGAQTSKELPGAEAVAEEDSTKMDVVAGTDETNNITNDHITHDEER